MRIVDRVKRDSRVLIVRGGEADLPPGPALAAHAAQAWCLGYPAVTHAAQLPEYVESLTEQLGQVDVVYACGSTPPAILADLVQATNMIAGCRLVADVRNWHDLHPADGASILLARKHTAAVAARMHAGAVLVCDPRLLELLGADGRHRSFAPRIRTRGHRHGVELAAAHGLAIAWPLGLESAWEFCALAAAASARRIGPAPVTWWDLESLDSRQPRNVANAA